MARKIRRKICIHIPECTQQIARSKIGCCLGRVKDWHQEDCFKFNDFKTEDADETNKKISSEWIGKKRMKNYFGKEA